MPRHSLLVGRSGSVYTPQLSDAIDFTGATDTSAAIEAFIARVPDGSTIRFPSSGICGYQDRGTPLWGNSAAYQVVRRHNLTIDGNGCQFVSLSLGDIHRYTWYVGGGSGITLENLHVVGSYPAFALNGANFEFQSPIWIEGVSGCNIVGNTLSNCYGYFINVFGDQNGAGGGNATNPSTNVLVDSNTMTNQWQGTPVGAYVGAQGFVVEGAVNLTVSNNTINHPGLNAIDIEPNFTTWPCHDIVFRNNVITNLNYSVLTCVGAATTGANCFNITIDNNTATQNVPSNCAEAIWAGNPAGAPMDAWTVTNNKLNTLARAVNFLNMTHCNVQHNTFHQFSGGCTGAGSPGAVMYGNQLPNGTVSNNFVDGGQAAYGISDQNITAGGSRSVFVANGNNTNWPANNF